MTIRSLLVANRGEIALRVFRTARDLGLRTIAVHTDLDADAPHVRAADEAVRVASYLDIDAVVAAAVACGADAIHPGYGFLSERAAFARAVESAGLVLVGPSAEVMDQMGRKDAAREIAVAAGVPVVPSFDLGAALPETAFPVLVKAAAGGGGKGMRIVGSAADLDGAVESARREADSAFGDDTLLIEKYVASGRHIEVQVLGDAHGTVLHFFERDCSTQRRHQKVLEEAPAPALSAGLRDRITAAAVALAEQVGYVNAGTVEFLLDNDSEDFYFLEMNTRLQVEHPVTELAVGVAGGPLDLVALQLRVAAGEPVGITQDEIAVVGHAIEARVYAEDSFNGFLPQAGAADLVRWPGPGSVRVDHALESGQVVSTAYDPMLGKIIASGPDRESARRHLLAAIDDSAVLGLTTNLGFLRALVASDEFREATIDTAWLDRHQVAAPDPEIARIAVAWASAASGSAAVAAHPFQADGWRAAGARAPYLVQLDEVVPVIRSGDPRSGTVGEHEVTELAATDHVCVLIVDGRREQVVVDLRPHALEAVHRGQRFVFERPDPFAERGPDAGDGTLVSPMPGTVLAVDVEAGESVVAGQRLGVLEAMKMEVALKAPYDGVVTTVGASTGDLVALKQVLFEVRPADAGTEA